MGYTQLTQDERYHIQHHLHQPLSQIAQDLGRSKSTISREIRRNSKNGSYRTADAVEHNRRRRSRSPYKRTAALCRSINRLIRLKLSPEQVCAYLEKHCGIRLHHSTVYAHIAQDKIRGGRLWQHLRIAAKPYRKRRGSIWTKGKVPDRTDIGNRPDIINRKQRIGDWEADTVVGLGQESALLTLVERKTKYLIIVRLNGLTAEETAMAMIGALKRHKANAHSVTMDNGKEFYRHIKVAKALGAKTYFCRPYRSWEKGLNENTNGLIRQYFPKGTDFNKISDAQIRRVQEALNNRPRKTLDYETPNSLFLGRFVKLI